MQRKAAIQITLFLLLQASSLACFAQQTSQSQVNLPEPMLSYNGQVAIALAQELIGQKKYSEALKQADKAIKADPKSGKPYMVKAYIFDMTGDSKKANAAHAKAVALSPNNGFVLNAYAAHLCGQQLFAEADQMFLMATKDVHYPLVHESFENAAQCALNNENLFLAEERARSALSINPDSLNALVAMAQVKFKQSKFFEARAFIQRLEALAPLNTALLKLAQQIEKSAGDDRAAARYQKQLDIMLQAQIQPPTGEGQKKP